MNRHRRIAKGKAVHMSNFLDERRYAWRMIRAARQVQATTTSIDGIATSREEIIALLDAALDAGLDRSELIVELANLGLASSRSAIPTPPRSTN
jgi:hypothetical protein